MINVNSKIYVDGHTGNITGDNKVTTAYDLWMEANHPLYFVK